MEGIDREGWRQSWSQSGRRGGFIGDELRGWQIESFLATLKLPLYLPHFETAAELNVLRRGRGQLAWIIRLRHYLRRVTFGISNRSINSLTSCTKFAAPAPFTTR